MNLASSIKAAQKTNIKQLAKTMAGRAIAAFRPARTQELYIQPTSNPICVQDRMLMEYLKKNALHQNHDEFFERLHQDFWQGDGGAVFSTNCDHRFSDLFLAQQKIDFKIVQRLWEQRKPRHIVEFGCNSGLLLNFLTTELNGWESATGIEINSAQVLRNKNATNLNPRIKFVCADGGNWLFANGRQDTLFVSNGGVLEYFRRERLDKMLTYISHQLSPAVFFAIEPIADDHDWSATTASIPFGNELSFSHNYVDLFESNGFKIAHQRAVNYESWKMMATVATVK